MKTNQEAQIAWLQSALLQYHQSDKPLPGLQPNGALECFIFQLIDSIRRVRYVSIRSQRDISASRADPLSDIFDPLLAAIHHQRAGNYEEAYWLIYIFTHFGLSARHGWELARAVYGGLGQRIWSWDMIANNLVEFKEWIDEVVDLLPGGFGNHRKYESKRKIGECVASYVEWVLPFGSHADLIAATSASASERQISHFKYLYFSLDSVLRFGRTAKFDYLAMLGKTQLVNISPDALYLQGSTGPIRGARMLFGTENTSVSEIDKWLMELAGALNVGAQEMEDSICNWQKSPCRYRRFHG